MMARRARELQRAYLQAAALIGALLMSATVVITSLQVFYRYVLSDPLVWAEEACRALLIWTCFLLAGAAFQRGEMIAVSLLTGWLSPKLRVAVMVPGYLVTCTFLVAMVYHGLVYASQNWIQSVPGLDILAQSLAGSDARVSIFWVYLAVPVGCAILALHMLLSALRAVMEAVAPPTASGAEV
jgi:TRAP-type C4-dicarboxylate transport system permease small subunit